MTIWSPNKAQWDEEDNDFLYKTTLKADGEHEVEEIPIERKGYKLLSEHVIKCGDCNKRLVDIIKVQEDESQKKVVKALCPCGGESFLYEISGKTFMQAAEGVAIADMSTDIIDGEIHLTIKVVK